MENEDVDLGTIDRIGRNRPLLKWFGSFLVGLPLLCLLSGLSSLQKGGIAGWFHDVFSVVMIIMLLLGVIMLIASFGRRGMCFWQRRACMQIRVSGFNPQGWPESVLKMFSRGRDHRFLVAGKHSFAGFSSFKEGSGKQELKFLLWRYRADVG